MPVPAPATPSRPRRGWSVPALRTTLGTVLLVVFLGAGVGPWWLSDPARLSRLVAWAVPDLDADVSFERVRLGWSGPLVFEGVTVAPRVGGAPPVAIRRIEGSHGLLAIALGGGDLGRLKVDGLEVDLAFDEQHRTNLERLVRQAEGGATGPRRSAVRMRLEIEDALVRITAPWTTEPWVSEPLDVRLALAAAEDGSSEWRLEPVQLLANARLDPPVAWGVLAYVAPVMANATTTSGRFSLTLDGARLPLGDAAAGTLSGALAMHEVVVGPGPLVTNLFAKLPGSFPPPPSIRIADESHVRFRLAERKVWHEGLRFGVPLPGPGRRLDVHSRGSVALDDQTLDLDLWLPIPGDLRQDRPLLAALAGKTVSVGVGGRLGEPRVEFDGSIRQVAGQVAAELVDRVNGRGAVAAPRADQPDPPPAGAAASTGEAIVDIVGDVIDEVARRRAARQAAGEQPEPPLLRRGRPRQRLLRPVLPPAAAEPSPAQPSVSAGD